ncbi:unnamed protein product [Rotaria sordida]|nr:unnamed protein product [Rotaria sordida]
MEQTNLDKSSGSTLLTTNININNFQGEQVLNDRFHLSVNDNKISDQGVVIIDEIETEIIVDSSNENRIHISTNLAMDHDYDMAIVDATTVTTDPSNKSSKKTIPRYLPAWEKQLESFYKTYTFDIFGIRHEKLVCWLYNKKDKNGNDSLGCKLCQKYQKTLNSNGKINLWCTTGYKIMKLSKIKEHKDNEVHKQAQELELQTASHSQPTWTTTQIKERNKHEAAIQNLILSAVYVCQQDQSLNSFEKLCTLIEALGVKLLPAEIGSVSYRNDNAALDFLRHIASYLHEEILEKIKNSPSIGWMLDESTSRTVEKSLIIYVRYLENDEAKTSFYGILALDGDGSADNIVKCIESLWRADDLNPEKTCWFATDNAATFTGTVPLFLFELSNISVVGINNGVIAKLKRDFGIEFVELNTCVAHTFALVGNQAGFIKYDNEEKSRKRELISKLEGIIGKIYQYFGSSATRTFKLKCWQNLLEIPELKFKRLFQIRWTAIRDSIKPIMLNITPENQALLATLQESKFDKSLTNNDRQAAADLLTSILDDEFLFMIHFHYDLHECVLGDLTKILQNDDLPYFTFMNIFNEKKIILNNWLSQKKESQPVLGPSLTEYVNHMKKNNSYGAFSIAAIDRLKMYSECFTHISQLLLEIDQRFKPSKVQQSFVVLFEPDYLIQNKDQVSKSNYGRQELEYLLYKYKNLTGFNISQCRNEWEIIKISLSEFVSNNQQQNSRRKFWKSFIIWKEAIDDSFRERHKNLLILLSIYLISPINSCECERGYSVSNRIQTNGRSRIMINTLDVLMNVRLLFPHDLRSDQCRNIIERAYKSWNGRDENRRINRAKLIVDVPDDYIAAKQARSTGKQKRHLTTTDDCPIKSKKQKTKAIKCANGCGKCIADNDLTEIHAIQCCHQTEYYDWVEDNCSRWLCNTCRIKLGISTESTTWFCEDCIDMHEEEEEQW